MNRDRENPWHALAYALSPKEDEPPAHKSDGSRASESDRIAITTIEPPGYCHRLKFTLPPEPVSVEEMAEHDRRVNPAFVVAFGPFGEPYMLPADARPGGITVVPSDDPAPTWLTARPVIFALGTAAGALFVLLLRGWA